jgi:hypothetical protein
MHAANVTLSRGLKLYRRYESVRADKFLRTESIAIQARFSNDLLVWKTERMVSEPC